LFIIIFQRYSVLTGLRVTRTATTESRQNNGCKKQALRKFDLAKDM